MGSWVKVAQVEDINPGEARRVEVDELSIAVFNVGGRFYALDDTCTHAEASLSEGEIDGEVIECPLHGGRYDLHTGRAVALPAVRGVAVHRVRVEGSDLLVEVGD